MLVSCEHQHCLTSCSRGVLPHRIRFLAEALIRLFVTRGVSARNQNELLRVLSEVRFSARYAFVSYSIGSYTPAASNLGILFSFLIRA